MRIIYINNPYDKTDNDFLITVKKRFDVEVMNFMKIRNIISFRATPTIVLIHDDLELTDENISCLLDCPTLEDVENALQQNYPYPEQPKTEPSEIELLGQEITNLKLSNIQKDMTINTLGQELTNIKLQLLLQGGM